MHLPRPLCTPLPPCHAHLPRRTPLPPLHALQISSIIPGYSNVKPEARAAAQAVAKANGAKVTKTIKERVTELEAAVGNNKKAILANKKAIQATHKALGKEVKARVAGQKANAIAITEVGALVPGAPPPLTMSAPLPRKSPPLLP